MKATAQGRCPPVGREVNAPIVCKSNFAAARRAEHTVWHSALAWTDTSFMFFQLIELVCKSAQDCFQKKNIYDWSFLLQKNNNCKLGYTKLMAINF